MRREYLVKKISDRIYQFRSCFANCYLLLGNEGGLLFDTGLGFFDIPAAIRNLTDKPLTVVCSHGHYDHIGGNTQWDGPIYLHTKDLALAAEHSSPEMREKAIRSQSSLWKRFLPAGGVPSSLDRQAYIHRPAFQNYLPVSEGKVFDLGGISAQVIEMPGHTAGSIALSCREEGVLLTGDAANGNLWLFLPESTSLSVYAGSLRHALDFSFELFCTGHDASALPRAKLSEYLAVAEDLDWDHGIAQKPPIQLQTEVRRCTRRGTRPSKTQPCIVISKGKLSDL